MLHRWMAVVVLASIMTIPFAARADRRAEAEKLAAAGELLFEAGKYADALRQFLDAYERFEPPQFVIPEVIWNIARCYEELGNDASAARYFEEFRQVARDPEYQRKAEEKLHAIRERMERMRAALTLEVEPEGTKVAVDGREVGEAPLAGPIRLDPGDHVVTLTRDGYRDRRETVTMKAQETRTLTVALERKVGTLRVVGVGGPATGPVRVLVDGQEVHRGRLPARVEVGAGQRVVRVEGPEGTEPVLRYVEVPDRGEVEVAKAFPLPAPKTPEPRPAPAPSATVTARPGAGFPWHFVVIGAGAAMLAGGGVMTALAAKDRAAITGADTYSDGTVKALTQTSASSSASSARTKDKVSYALYGVGGAAVVGGVLWWVLGRDSRDTVATIPSAVPVDGGALIGAVGRF